MKTITIKGQTSSGKTMIAEILRKNIPNSEIIHDNDFQNIRLYPTTLIIDEVKDFNKYKEQIFNVGYLILIGE